MYFDGTIWLAQHLLTSAKKQHVHNRMVLSIQHVDTGEQRLRVKGHRYRCVWLRRHIFLVVGLRGVRR